MLKTGAVKRNTAKSSGCRYRIAARFRRAFWWPRAVFWASSAGQKGGVCGRCFSTGGLWNVENFFETPQFGPCSQRAVISLETLKKPHCKAKKQVFRFTFMGAVKTKTGCFGPGFKQSAVVVLKTFLSTLAPYLLPCMVVVCPCWGGGVPHPNIGGWGLADAVVKKGAITTSPKKFSTLPLCQRGKYPRCSAGCAAAYPAENPLIFWQLL